MLHVSAAAFVFSKSVEKEGSLLKLVTALFVKALKNAMEVLAITHILRITVHEKHEVVIIGDGSQHIMSENEPAHHSFSKYLVLEPSGTELVGHVASIKRPVMLCEDNLNLRSPNHLVCIDYSRPDFPITSVSVPYWPVQGDMVLIKGDELEPWRALVQTINQRARTVKALFYVPHPRWGRDSSLWVREGSVSQTNLRKSILGIWKGTWRGQGIRLFAEDD